MVNYDREEKIIFQAVLKARYIQDYLWKDRSYTKKSYIDNHKNWLKAFQKRVDKIALIQFDNDSYIIELRKRLLQQAALSIAALGLLDKYN